ncbi:hypothetical protein DFP72DRAFT_891240 [Ephemerocybe angulata]|uniref:UspA domain-containing protein n=1 Tax=Ephemerocybe angulata TaxID=980116 RepID=A0A8H6M9X4_9AGAR|nr:hypothetical protein DFP72DRAFT_891240 [Tulosesus angulatus]
MSNDDAGKDRRQSWRPKLTRLGSSSGRTTPTGGPPPRPGSSSAGGSGGLSFAFSKINGEKRIATPPTGLPTPNGDPVMPSPASSKRSSLSRNQSFESPPASAPGTPKRRFSSGLLTPMLPQDLDEALERTQSRTAKPGDASKQSSFGKSITSMMGGLSGITLSRTSTRESTTADDRGRSMFSGKRWRSSSQVPSEGGDDRSRSRARSQSPFILRRWRTRDSSPPIGRLPLNHSDAELSEAESTTPHRSAYDDRYEYQDSEVYDEASDDSFSDEDYFDPETERNTEQNAIIAPAPSEAVPEVEDPDPVGEGVNVIIPPEPYFPSSLNTLGSVRGKRNPRRRKSVRAHEPLPLNTSRPVFQRDRCTITITQGDPESKLEEEQRKRRRYVVASDLSEESRYAVEWGIGTVLRDGDEMLLVTIVENEARIDPISSEKQTDRSAKLRSQQERQGMAYILARQVTSLLQRTKLHVTVACQAWHAKQARHMLLDIVDYMEPAMLIVGSRGLSQLNGILLGSTSHYLIERCSVPVMVARRRLKRPPRKAAHLSTSRTRVKLAEAGIDRVAGRVDEDVEAMRDELHKEDQRRAGGPGSRNGLRDYPATGEVPEDDEADGEEENDDDDEPRITLHGP